ncbi:MAG TPA: glycosyltransferase family 9 protein [Planctomycetota bacterium]|nr:glycosyltransferase family 9 protein [Planctomycetota bacterium]
MRRRLRLGMNSVLRRCVRPFIGTEEAGTSGVERILVCRLNRRLGNVLFLTPLLNALEAKFPRAKVDVLLGDASLAPLLGNRPNVGEVFGLEKWNYRKMGQLVGLLRRLRRAHYDLTIDPSVNSFSGRVACALVHAKARAGFEFPGQWLPLDHPVPLSKEHLHSARVPLAIVAGLGTYPNAVFEARLDLRLSAQEREEGARELASQLSAQNAWRSGERIIGFFTGARDAKAIPESWWTGWIAAMRERAPDVRLVQLVPPGAGANFPGIPSIVCADYRLLGAMLANLSLFVSADTGPMHLASAARVPTVGLFNVTNPASYGPIGADDEAIVVTGVEPEQVAERALRRLALVLGRSDARIPADV